MSRVASNRLVLYMLLNLGFVLFVALASIAGGLPNPRLLHLILLFAICSNFVIDLDGLNGRYALLALFMLNYFVAYGVGDITNLLLRSELPSLAPPGSALSPLSKTEAVILMGGLMLVFGYRVAVFLATIRRLARTPRDWAKNAILIVGAIMWVVGTLATYRWNVYIVPDTTNEATRKGIASISPITVTAYILAQMCQPLGILLLVYAHRVYRSTYLLPVIVGIVILQLFIGFVVDIKGLAMLGIILVTATALLVEGRLPKFWLVAGVLFVIFLFPFFQSYRATIHGGHSLARTTVVENFGKVLELTVAAKDKVNSGRDRAPTFLERGSLKGITSVIVEKSGNEVDFQRGYTLSPLLATFVPRILWSGKQTVPTGQMVNKIFHITDSDDIWISPSHLGELYWNFGWPGVVLGMCLIGFICGSVGARFNLAEYTTVTRVLVIVLTIKLLIVGFEGPISDIYVVWLRSLAGIGLLHLMFARVPAAYRPLGPIDSRSEVTPAGQPPREQLFPNLLS
jgi:hypothetical protein